ncbi:MAG: hypothetical protein WCV73_03905 [Patescibacteria group bacterium]
MINKKKISIFFLTAVFLFVLANFLFVFNQALAQAADPLSPAILLQQKLQNLTLERMAAVDQKDSISLQVIDAQIKATKYQQKIQWLKDTARTIWKEGVLRAGKIAYKNALRTFLSRIAYDTATRLAEGGIGKSPLFDIKGLSALVDDVYQTTLADTLSVLASTNGFFNFDVCQPSDINLSLAIQYSLFGNFNGRGPRGAPKCTFRQISERWDEWWGSNVKDNTQNFLQNFKAAFDPAQTDAGIYLTLDSSIRSRLQDEKTKKLFDSINRDGIQPITEPISGFIKTPVAITKSGAAELAKSGPVAETVSTGDIVADSIGIFTNTLASKLLKQLFDKGLTSGKRAQSTLTFNWVNTQVARTQATSVFANLAEVSYSSGQERLLEPLSTCQNPYNPGPTECVFSPKLVGAIEQGLTVKEALAKGQLRAAGLVGYKSNGNLSWLDDYPYRSLLIMRIQRILPVGWEQAALYNQKVFKEVTLGQIVDCFEDPADPENPKKPTGCRQDINGDSFINEEDFNPYFHLIDPNWVLKAPESYCVKKSFGPNIVSSASECLEDNVAETRDPNNNNELVEGPACETTLSNPDKPVQTVVRGDEYCADRKTCLEDDASGNCTSGEYGYCVKEKEVWRFPGGESCQPYYNTCETLSRNADSKSFSYLRNTLKECSAGAAGCLWYSTNQTKASGSWQWQDEARVYLNEKALNCGANEVGCTQLTVLKPGVNTIFNGDFGSSENNLTPDGWQGTNGCAIVLDSEGKNNNGLKITAAGNSCSASTIGFIPLNSRFGYTFVVSFKSPDQATAGASLNFYERAADNSLINNATQAMNLPDVTGQWQTYSGVVSNIPSNANFVKVNLTATGNGDLFYDEAQLIISQSPIVKDQEINFSVDPSRYQIDYSHDDSYARTFLKTPPDYLACEGYNQVERRFATQEACETNRKVWRQDIKLCVSSGSTNCNNYAAVCQAQEIGCQGYKPLSGDPEVSAVAGEGDVCPAVCVGFESFLQQPNYFDVAENANVQASYQNFIPNTAAVCSANNNGCEQFTNLDEVAKGGEGIEYFKQFRQCVSPNNANIKTYYTWEGSDTTGYQLKKWEFLGSSVDEGPCTNIGMNSEECTDTQDNMFRCTQADIDNGISDCRHFFNKDNEPFFVLESKAITASVSCRPYRRTSTGQVYNADPRPGDTCPAAANNCREYSGNRGNNVKTILTDTFEKKTLGDWENIVGSTYGLIPSNEAIYQGGHSMLVATPNAAVYYPLNNKLVSGHEYLLSFWAKKANGSKVSPKNNNPQGQTVDLLNFSLTNDNLTNDWTLYTVGPILFTSNGANLAKLKFSIEGLGNDEVYYLDNVVLKEFTNSFYVIKDSWETEQVCNDPYPGAYLGCQAYTDRQGQSNNYFKGFANLCSPAAIGCEAFIDTQNNSNYQASHLYRVNDQDIVTVANDRLVYLVNDVTKQCSAEKQGCSLLGKPTLDRQESEAGTVVGYNDIYKINNPDSYSAHLCSESGLFCTTFKGETGASNRYYYDPEALSGNGANMVQSCYYANGHWYKSGSTGGNAEPCPGSYNFHMLASNQEGYSNWVGVCPANQSTCTEFRDPSASINEEVKQCDAQISPTMLGTCVVGQNGAEEQNNDDYCSLSINGVRHKVCKLNGADRCAYTASDWTCLSEPAQYNDQGQLEAGTGNCQVNNQKVCFIPSGNTTSCTYSLLCRSDSYYYLHNSLDTTATCNTVDREAGCLLFNDTLNGNLSYSNKGSNDGAEASGCDAWENFGSNRYCDANKIIKVKKDRQCGEWLECKTGFEQPKVGKSGEKEFVCLDLYRCSQKGTGDRDCVKIISQAGADTSIYTLPADIDKIRNLSGYSHPGLKWNDNIQTVGYASPEAMTQKGQPLEVVNGGFETYLGGDLSKPEGWKTSHRNEDEINSSYISNACSASLDQDSGNVHSGRYSLRLSLISLQHPDGNDGNVYCDFRSDAGEDKYYQIIDSSNYNLSFWAKSENNAQAAAVTLAFYNNSRYLGGDDLRLDIMPSTKWQKYVISYGNLTRPIPNSANQARIFFYNYAGPNFSGVSNGSIWFDDFAIEPVLVLDERNNISVAKDCRLYPTEEAPACSYQGLSSKYEGWQGYCLEPDPANAEQCLQWYPVDSLMGDRLSVFSTQSTISYTDRSPLYYCAQTAGMYNFAPDLQGNYLGTVGYKYQPIVNIQQGGPHDQCNDNHALDGGMGSNLRICVDNDADPANSNFPVWSNSCGSKDSSFCNVNQQVCEDQNHINYCKVKESQGCKDVCPTLTQEACSAHRGCVWNYSCIRVEDANHHACINAQNQNTCDYNWQYDGCGWDQPCESKTTNAICSSLSPSQCLAPCVFTKTIDNGNSSYLYTIHDWLTLDEIGAIKLEITGNSGSDFGTGVYFSDVTDQLDSVTAWGGFKPEDLSKYKKVFNAYDNSTGQGGYSIFFSFDEDPGTNNLRLQRVDVTAGDSDQFGGFSGKLYFYLKEQCSLIAQVVKTEGNVVKEKTWLGRFSAWTDMASNVLGLNKKIDQSPYGSFYAPKNTTPDYWSELGANGRKDAPVYIYNGGSFDFGPGTPLAWSVPERSAFIAGTPGRICASSENKSLIGKECRTSSDCGTNGVCSGIGKYCYSAQGITNGKACNGDNDCSVTQGFRCENPENLVAAPTQNMSSEAVAISRLQQLFAKVYGVWQWDQNEGIYKTLEMDNLDISPNKPGGWAGSDWPKVDSAIITDNILNAPGGKVELNFTANGSVDQLPIDGIWINWNDGNVDYFKGPLGYKPSVSSPYKAYHVYTCQTNDRGDRCVACLGAGTLDDGSCSYPAPVITFKDHWGWCSYNSFRGQAYVDQGVCNSLFGKQADKSVTIQRIQ